MDGSLRGLATGKGQAFFVVTAVFLAMAVITGLLRIWAKVIVGRHFQVYDYVAFGACACMIGFGVDSFLCVYPGTIGMHLPDAIKLGPEVMKTTLKIFYSAGYVWITSTTLIKLSLLHFYQGVFFGRAVSTKRSTILQYVGYALYVLTLLYWLSHICLLLFICQPIQKQWNPTVSGHCGGITKQEISSSAVNMILDLAIVVLPMPEIWLLQLPFKKKIAINVILSLGSCICIINVARLALVATTGASDFTYSSADVGLLSGLEVYIGFICCSLPTLGPIFRRHRLVQEAGARKYYYSRGGDRSGKPLRPSKKSFGHSLLRTRESLQPLGDGDIPLQGSDDLRNYSGIATQ